MHLHNIVGQNSAASIASLLQNVNTATAPATTAPVATSSAQTSLSSTAGILSQLSQLATANPTEFKSLTSQFASELQTLASKSTGAQSSFLTKLAAKFQAASQTGSVTGLVPTSSSTSAYTSTGAATGNPIGSALSSLFSLFGKDTNNSGGTTSAATSSSNAASSSSSVANIFSTLQQELSTALTGSSSLSTGISLLA